MPEGSGSPSWARPGSSHDRLVRLLKFGLPALGLILLLLLAIAPFGKKSEVSFLLDKNKADKAQERMRVESARYTGSDDKGQPFEITAKLLALSEFVTKNLAICVSCGNPANKSQRLSTSRKRIEVGASDKYEARCRRCFKPE